MHLQNTVTCIGRSMHAFMSHVGEALLLEGCLGLLHLHVHISIAHAGPERPVKPCRDDIEQPKESTSIPTTPAI